jgi:archaellum component FlaC
MEWEYFKDQVGEIKDSLECIFNKIDDLNKLVGKQGENIAIIRTEIGTSTNTGIILRLKILEDKVEGMEKSFIDGMKTKIKDFKAKPPAWKTVIQVIGFLITISLFAYITYDRVEKTGVDKAIVQQAIAPTPNPTP